MDPAPAAYLYNVAHAETPRDAHTVRNGTPLAAATHVREDMVAPGGELMNASAADYHERRRFIGDRDIIDGSAAATAGTRTGHHYGRLRQVSLEKTNSALVTSPVTKARR